MFTIWVSGSDMARNGFETAEIEGAFPNPN
jgi:hypothetical protein